jgi:hypothetical protein
MTFFLVAVPDETEPDLLKRAKRDLKILGDRIAMHDYAIRRHESDKQVVAKSIDDLKTFIRLSDRYVEDADKLESMR